MLALDVRNNIRRAWEWIGFDDNKNIMKQTEISKYTYVSNKHKSIKNISR